MVLTNIKQDTGFSLQWELLLRSCGVRCGPDKLVPWGCPGCSSPQHCSISPSRQLLESSPSSAQSFWNNREVPPPHWCQLRSLHGRIFGALGGISFDLQPQRQILIRVLGDLKVQSWICVSLLTQKPSLRCSVPITCRKSISRTHFSPVS